MGAVTRGPDVAPVAGVDGCRAGWVIAVLHGASEPRGDARPPGHAAGTTDHPPGAPADRWTGDLHISFSVVDRLDDLVEAVATARIAAMAVDMPIGLPDAGRRACDVAARARLGPRRSSVFPAPVRGVLGASDHADAVLRSRAATGQGLSLQAFHLLPKVAELDTLVAPELQDRVVEAHPELAYARLAGRPATHPKRTREGQVERRTLLAAAGIDVAAGLRLRGAAHDDVLDAAVLTLTAARVRDGTAVRLGDGATDARGLRMEIVV